MEDNKIVVRCIKVGSGSYLNSGEEYAVEKEEENHYLIKISGIERGFKKSRFEIVEKKKYSFREVIANIKENEEYRCQEFRVKCLDDNTIEMIAPIENIIGFYASDLFTKSGESLKYAIDKENRCYNEKCNRNNKSGNCDYKEKYYIDNCIDKDIEQPIPINYEEEYYKYKKLAENLKEDIDKFINKFNEIKAKNEELKKEIEDNNQIIENEYENKLFLAEQESKKTIDSLMLVNDKYMEKQKAMESDLIKYESTIKNLKETIKGLANLL